MGRSAKSSKRRGPKARPLRMGPVTNFEGERANACVTCGAVQHDKFDSTLMCALGHATCFGCVAASVQPHALCGHACNGFKYRCAGCKIWLCINKTQELAMMCGGHALARLRLDEEEIDSRVFDAPGAYATSGEEEEEEEEEYTHSSSSSSASDDYDERSCCPCEAARAHGDDGECHDRTVPVQLPRVCCVDWTTGREQRAVRLTRLRASLLGL